jgi:phosphotransferase system HPr (HPr) family protein
MPERSVTVTHDVGLHARPAALFVKTASGFQSEIRVRHSDKTANAKSILEILTLDAGANAELIISAQGADAETALDALEAALKAD